MSLSGYNQLHIEAARLGQGTHRIVCPFCSGGAERERSLHLEVGSGTGQVVFRCYRASCGTSGGNRAKRAIRKNRESRPFIHSTVTLDSEHSDALRRQFGFVPPHTTYSEDARRYVYEVRDPRGLIRGHIARTFEAGVSPKVLTYCVKTDQPFIGWAATEIAGTVLAVEDWISAEKVQVSGAASAVALNGTYLSLDMVEEMVRVADGRQVVLALDRDAYAKAIDYSKRYGELFAPRLRVARLKRDLKHEPSERIREVVASGTFDFCC